LITEYPMRKAKIRLKLRIGG